MALPEDVVALVPMRNVVLFPHVLMPITVGRTRSLAALRQAVAADAPLGIVLQKKAQVDEPGFDDLCAVGTLATVVRQVDAADGQIHAVCHGQQRFRLLELVPGHPFLAARIRAHRGARAAVDRRRGAGHAVARAGGGDPLAAARRARRAGARAAGHARALAAGRHHRQPDGRRAVREADAAGDAVHRRTAAEGAGVADAPHRGAAPVAGDRRAHQGATAGPRAQVHPARAAQDDPEGTGRRGRSRPGDRAPGAGHRQGRHAARHRSPCAQGVAAAAPHLRHAVPRPGRCRPGSSGWSNCPGACPKARPSTWPRPVPRWRPITSGSSA